MYKRGLCAIVFVFVCVVAQAQVPCSQLLQQAQEAYDNGTILQIPISIQDCIGSGGFTKEEEIRAKKLNTLAYIFADSVQASEQAMIDFLRADPEHQLNPLTDPRELFYLYGRFRTEPIFRLRGAVFANFTSANTITAFGVENVKQNLESSRLGAAAGVRVEIERAFFDRRLELSGGAQFSFRSFTLENPIFDHAEYQLSERQFSIGLPISARVLFLRKQRTQPYFSIGWGPSFLVSAVLEGDRQGGQTVSLSGENLLASGLRRRSNHYAFAGIGFRVRTPNRKGFYFMELSYQQTLNNMSNPGNRYVEEVQELPFRFGYVDNDFSLQVFHLNLGYILSVYKPKKLKRYKTEWELAMEKNERFSSRARTKEKKQRSRQKKN